MRGAITPIAVFWTVLTLLFSAVELVVYGRVLDAFCASQAAEGRVLAVDVHGLAISRSRNRGGETRQVPAVYYEFTAAGALHRSARLYLFDHPMMSDPQSGGPLLDSIRRTYSPESKVEVRYCASDPGISYLERGGRRYFAYVAKDFLVMWVPGMILCTLAWLAARAVRARRRGAPRGTAP